ncbi:choice-of-anchor I family protein [Lacibacter sp.]|uniref:choice-of-anchor I family protein n=1 Tax=Lacibacter sp. TaxID=1915409 RepID=UPI002B4B5F04|nr:choice-of-anchor I family protein [Lacibacter sp.]HLP35259.1 choice-of-anchor I family protein [Lacibacter sp.]
MRKPLLLISSIVLLNACKKLSTEQENSKQNNGFAARQESPSFSEISSLAIGGGTGAAEISTFDPETKKLFVVNNSAGNNRIEVVDLSNPASPVITGNINIAIYGGLVNSVSVSNGKLAAAIEAIPKTNNGKVVVFNTTTHDATAVVTVGALPDMITFTPNGNFILTANEGEPNDTYTIDPLGTISIIDVNNNYAATTLDFSMFASRAAELKTKGFRLFGKNASFEQDVEPEYIAVSTNSNTAWVTLQENNGIAKIDLTTKTITDIFPLGFKDYNNPMNTIDPSDQDGGINFGAWPVKGMYLPDAIAVNSHNGVPFVYSANEGDAREYAGLTPVEQRRVNHASVILDPVAFPNAAALKTNAQLGRLNITTTLGDTDGDGDYDELYSYGARSFSIWNGLTGQLVYDSKNQIDTKAAELGKYPDGRSDDKGCEPEGITTGRVGNKSLLFVGLERANAVMIYDITNPTKPVFSQWLNTGVGPEGVLFVSADKSPNGKSLFIASSETDGFIKVYSTN